MGDASRCMWCLSEGKPNQIEYADELLIDLMYLLYCAHPPRQLAFQRSKHWSLTANPGSPPAAVVFSVKSFITTVATWQRCNTTAAIAVVCNNMLNINGHTERPDLNAVQCCNSETKACQKSCMY